MTYNEALNKINSLMLFGSRPGLDRIKLFLKKIGNPQDKLKFVHIAGTNGKGSVCTILSSVLTEAGYKTGLFISPYVVDFRERMQINGEMISKEELTQCVEELFPVLEELRANGTIITEFEFIMALSFKWFLDKKCDIVVLETGLGGKLDCTNVIKTPLASVITSISFDHTAILGNTIEEITSQKAGIIKENGNTVFYPQEDIVNTIIQMTAKEMNNTLIYANQISLSIKSFEITGTVLNYKGNELKLKLIGRHQLTNAKIALAAIELLRQKENINISDINISAGFARATIPARLELLGTSPIVLLDGAHNPDGMKALSAAIKDYLPNKKIVCIMGMLKDKDSNSSLEYLDGLIDVVITLEPDNPRKQTADELALKAVKFFDVVYPLDDFGSAVDMALKRAGKDGAVIICGSLYLASQLRDIAIKKIQS